MNSFLQCSGRRAIWPAQSLSPLHRQYSVSQSLCFQGAKKTSGTIACVDLPRPCISKLPVIRQHCIALVLVLSHHLCLHAVCSILSFVPRLHCLACFFFTLENTCPCFFSKLIAKKNTGQWSLGTSILCSELAGVH